MRINALAVTFFATLVTTSAFAQDAGSGILRVVEFGAGVRPSWRMGGDESQVGSRMGCYEGLTRFDFDNSLKPSLATSWTQTSPTTWEFVLRDNVKFHDGQPLNATNAVNALNNLLLAPLPARSFSPKLIKSVEAVGDKVVKITTIEPLVVLPRNMAAPHTAILSPAAYNKDGTVNPVNTCTGPFITTVIDHAIGRITVMRNEEYWGGKPALTGADIRFIGDANTRVMQIRTGETDIARAIPPSAIADLEGTPGIELAAVNEPRSVMILLNHKRPPFDNIKFRQAVQAAIDNEGLAASVYENYADAAYGPFRPTDQQAPQDDKPTYDVEKAKALLEEAGVKPGTVKVGLQTYTSRAELKDVAAVIQDQLKDIGIQVDIKVAEYAAIEPDILSGNYDMTIITRSYLDMEEPLAYLSSDYSCGGSFNVSKYCSEEVDAKIKEIYITPDREKRLAMYADIAKTLQSEAVTVFLVFQTSYDAYSEKVKNFQAHPHANYLLTPALAID